MKIIFLGDWGESSESMLTRYARQTPNNSGKWGKLVGTSDFDEADFYVVMDRPGDRLPPLEKTIYLQREPKNLKRPWMNLNFPNDLFYNGSYENCHNVVTWWLDKNFDELVALPKPNYNKLLSTVTSGRRHLPEANDRLDFLKRFINNYKNIDVYGRGTGSEVPSQVYKGPLNYAGNCKFKGHYGYKYSFVFENTTEKNSWTEKPADSLLCWSYPFYFGCPNLNDYIPENSFHQLNHELHTQPIDPIINLLNTDPNFDAIAEARENILYKWNIWPTIERIINERS